MYVLVGEFRVSWNISTVPLTQFSRNMVFSCNQSGCKSGNRCTIVIYHKFYYFKIQPECPIGPQIIKFKNLDDFEDLFSVFSRP